MTQPRPVIRRYALRRMAERGIPLEAVEEVLQTYQVRRPAPLRPGAQPTEILIGDYRGRRLKVYVERDSDPFRVKTAVGKVRTSEVRTMTDAVEYDADGGVLYVRLREGGTTSKTIALDDLRLIDYSKGGEMLGVEFLDPASGIDLRDVPEARTVERLIRESGFEFPIFA